MPTPEAIDLVGRIRARYKAPGNEHELELIEAAEEIDCFAAQRGAEADRLVHLFARVIVEGDGAFTGREWEAALCEAERINRGAQAGGGDAPVFESTDGIITIELRGEDAERASEIFDAMEGLLLKIGDIGLLSMKTKPSQTGGGDAVERARAIADSFNCHMIDKRNDWPNSSYNQLFRVIRAALRSSHREGAEAMRDELDKAGYVIVPREPTKAMLRAAWAAAHDEDAPEVWREMIDAAPALPIPGKTDATHG